MILDKATQSGLHLINFTKIGTFGQSQTKFFYILGQNLYCYDISANTTNSTSITTKLEKMIKQMRAENGLLYIWIENPATFTA